MPAAKKHPPLQPMTAVSLGVVFAHLILGFALWLLLSLMSTGSATDVAAKVEDDGRYWFAPSDFIRNGGLPPPASIPLPAPVAAKKAEASHPLDPIALEPTPPSFTAPTNKVITLSPVFIEGTQKIPVVKSTLPPITMMDMLHQEKLEALTKEALGGPDMDPVLKALEESLIKEWKAPALQKIPISFRNAVLKITIGREGDVLEFLMSKSSGSPLLDQSVQDAATRVKKISKSLPSSFPKDRYTVEVNFHIE